MAKMIRVRIAPSPTGNLHIGTARTALFNYLFAKHNNGKFILRIEDTDIERSDKKYEKDIFNGLNWLGIEADESPEKSGPYGPYRQSERIETYKKYIEKLLQDGKAFYCFHTEEELENEKQKLIEEKRPQLHLCEFRTMDIKEAETLKDIKTNYIIRFKTPAGKTIKFNDLIRGEVSFESDLLGDFSIAKNVETPLYNFAVVIDDKEMKISHVIRGEDHISNTPKQILLAEALGFNLPQYAHLPLILGEDRSKLSKRHGATSLTEYREAGYLPEALFNFLALLGWNPGGDKEIFTEEELIAEFPKELIAESSEELIAESSIEKIQKSGAIFDIKKLDWMNGEYIRKKNLEELVELCRPYLINFFQNINFKIPNLNDYVKHIIALEQPRLKKLSEIRELAEYFFRKPSYDKQLLRWKIMSDSEILDSLNRSEKIILGETFDLQRPYDSLLRKEDGTSIGPGEIGPVLWPLRVALTGKKASPGPSEIMEILGKEESLKRIELAKLKLNK